MGRLGLILPHDLKYPASLIPSSLSTHLKTIIHFLPPGQKMSSHFTCSSWAANIVMLTFSLHPHLLGHQFSPIPSNTIPPKVPLLHIFGYPALPFFPSEEKTLCLSHMLLSYKLHL